MFLKGVCGLRSRKKQGYNVCSFIKRCLEQVVCRGEIYNYTKVDLE